MSKHPTKRQVYSIAVDAVPGGCTWTVNRADRPAMSGLARNPESAERSGAFAAATLEILDRIGQRSF